MRSREFKFKARMNKCGPTWKEQYSWVADTFGPRGEAWVVRRNTYRFKDESDLIMFNMRWS